MISYAEAIPIRFPGVTFIVPGDGTVYEDFQFIDGTPPTKVELDTFISEYTKEQMWLKIKDERDRRKIDGGYKVGNNWFHSDTYSRTQQLGLVMMGANLPNNVMWKTMSGSFVLMTPTIASQIFQAAITSDIILHSVAEQKKADMLASANPGNYDWESGWPVSYGE